MTLTVDPRMGSGDLALPLSKRGLPVTVAQMDYGDVAWLGNGPEGPIPVGVEVKTLSDVLGCIQSGRFAGHQLPGLQNSYSSAYLLVEGQWKPGDEGELLTWKGSWRPIKLGMKRWLYRQLEQWLTTMEILGGIHIRRTGSRAETVAMLHALYVWWTSKGIEEHKSHMAMHTPATGLRRPSLKTKVAMQLPGIGPDLAVKASDYFKSVKQMVNATVQDWQEIEGIGKGKAVAVVEAVA